MVPELDQNLTFGTFCSNVVLKISKHGGPWPGENQLFWHPNSAKSNPNPTFATQLHHYFAGFFNSSISFWEAIWVQNCSSKIVNRWGFQITCGCWTPCFLERYLIISLQKKWFSESDLKFLVFFGYTLSKMDGWDAFWKCYCLCLVSLFTKHWRM